LRFAQQLATTLDASLTLGNCAQISLPQREMARDTGVTAATILPKFGGARAFLDFA
jgi:hypothetical protein